MPFSLGAPELILILIVALVVFGPGKLPEIGGAVGKGIREFRKASSDVTAEFTREAKAIKEAAASEPAPVCPSCGQTAERGVKFCASCGATMTAATAPTSRS